MELVVLSSFPSHASGNVGDKLLLESSIELIEAAHGRTEFNVHWRGEDFTSRLEYLNRMDAILLCGFEYTKIRSGEYRIAENLDAVEPPLIPLGAIHRFFPGDERALTAQQLDGRVRSFLDRVAKNCPNEQLPVRTEWVGRILRQNGFRTTLTGDPGWYDPAFIGEPFHKPETIDRIVFTTPHWSMYVDQAKELLRRISRQFPDAERTVVLHSAPNDVDRELVRFARTFGWESHYASHEMENIEQYRESDLHIGYRKHGHLAHLRWRRPSVILEEDSRARGLTETLGTAGIPAFEPRTGLPRRLGEVYDRVPVVGAYFMLEEYGLDHLVPPRQWLVAPPNPTAVDEALEFTTAQQTTGWKAFERVQETIDSTYEEGMQPFLRDALNPLQS